MKFTLFETINKTDQTYTPNKGNTLATPLLEKIKIIVTRNNSLHICLFNVDQ